MFTITNIAGRQVTLYADANPQYCLIQPVDKADESVLESQLTHLKSLIGDKPILFAAFKINDWNAELSPWPAPAVFGDATFGDGAQATLEYVSQGLVPELKQQFALPAETKFIIGGYSLAAFFSVWAGYESDIFTGVAAASPSVWFINWDKYMESHTLKATTVYLSLGDKEEKTRNQTMKQVGDRIRMMNENYTALLGDNTTLEMNQGNHFKDTDIRTAKAFAWVVNKL